MVKKRHAHRRAMSNDKTAIIFFLLDTIEEIDTKSEKEEKEMSIELVLPAEELFHLKVVCVFFSEHNKQI